jgi:hypothetical protein
MSQAMREAARLEMAKAHAAQATEVAGQFSEASELRAAALSYF